MNYNSDEKWENKIKTLDFFLIFRSFELLNLSILASTNLLFDMLIKEKYKQENHEFTQKKCETREIALLYSILVKNLGNDTKENVLNQ